MQQGRIRGNQSDALGRPDVTTQQHERRNLVGKRSCYGSGYDTEAHCGLLVNGFATRQRIATLLKYRMRAPPSGPVHVHVSQIRKTID